MEDFAGVETLIIELLLIVSVVAVVVRRLRIPYTVALVLAGLLISWQPAPEIRLTPDLILTLFLPPLVFEAAIHVNYRRLREDLVPIVALAVPGVLISAAVVGVVVSYGAGIPLIAALVFGALISSTDPVAVVALFRSIGVPRRLMMLVEGESLFNDGASIVLFNVLVAAAVTGVAAQPAGELAAEAVVDFLRVAIGGIAIGASLGWIVSRIGARIDDYLVVTTVTTVLAFGSYLLAESVEVSGVLAVVAAGMVVGNLGTRQMTATTRIGMLSFWEYLGFVANSLIFLLIGLAVDMPQLLEQLGTISLAVIAVLLSRAVAVYGLSALVNIRAARVPLAYQHVLFWGGLRGAVGLALALSLPTAFANAELLQTMAFGVVIFTLLVQGTTMSGLLRRLKLVQHHDQELEYQRRYAQLVTVQAGQARLSELHRRGLLSAAAWDRLAPRLDAELHEARDAQHQLLSREPTLVDAELEDAMRENLRERRAALVALHGDGAISETVYDELASALDRELDQSPE